MVRKESGEFLSKKMLNKIFKLKCYEMLLSQTANKVVVNIFTVISFDFYCMPLEIFFFILRIYFAAQLY